MATLCFFPALCAGIIAILLIVFTRYVSLGSLVFVALTPISLLVFGLIQGFDWPIFWSSLVICLFAFWRHRSNIVKIVQGRENKIGSGGSKGGKGIVK
jgi:glycerol-3-phosphate acyltransferase PlsY